MRKYTGALAALFLLAGCAGAAESADTGSGSAVTPPTAPPHKLLHVVITDEGQLDVYFNLDNRNCTATSFLDTVAGETTPRPQVVVRDGAGKVLATTKAPRVGGEFKRSSGCTVTVPVEVPAVDFYEVTVTAGADAIERTTTVPGESTEARLRF